MKLSSLYILILLTGIQFSCHSQLPLLSYNDAIARCKPDTTNHNGSISYYYWNADCLVGGQLPDFTATTMDGKTIDRKYFEGKVSVINFWFKGCLPCQMEMPAFNNLKEKYKGQAVNFLAVGRNTEDIITDFMIEHPFHFDMVANGDPIIGGAFQTRWGYPLTFVVDKHLKIIKTARSLNEDVMNAELVPLIDAALKEK